MGSLLGASSPVVTHTPLLGAEVMLAPGKSLEIEVDPTFEHGVLLDVGAIDVEAPGARPQRPLPRPARARRHHRHGARGG